MNEELVRELLAKSDAQLRAALEAMLPKPTHPEHMFDRWAKHPKHGKVKCAWDVADDDGHMYIRWRSDEAELGVDSDYVPVDELTFPDQTTRPEDVPVGEAWLVNVDDGNDSGERVVALKAEGGEWRTGAGVVGYTSWWEDREVTLIEPLIPARPEPQSEPEHPATLSSLEDYEDAPEGTIVASSDNTPWVKSFDDEWMNAWIASRKTNSGMVDTERQVLRKGWG